MHTRALSLNDAFTLVRDRKPDVSPNFHFMQQLHVFERQLGHQDPNNLIHHQHPPSQQEHEQEYYHSHHHHSHHTAHLHSHHPTAMDESSSSNIIDIDGRLQTTTDSMIDISGLPSSSPSSSLDITMVQPKYSCNCLSEVCKGVQHPGSGYLTQLAKAATGISPDSGIEFDRWASSTSDTSSK